MYGTIARMQVRPGMTDAFLAWADTTARVERTIPGHVETIVYQLDTDPGVLMMAVVFESREAYQANAASPVQHAEFEKMMSYLSAEPDWHDGAILFRG